MLKEYAQLKHEGITVVDYKPEDVPKARMLQYRVFPVPKQRALIFQVRCATLQPRACTERSFSRGRCIVLAVGRFVTRQLIHSLWVQSDRSQRHVGDIRLRYPVLCMQSLLRTAYPSSPKSK